MWTGTQELKQFCQHAVLAMGTCFQQTESSLHPHLLKPARAILTTEQKQYSYATVHIDCR